MQHPVRIRVTKVDMILETSFLTTIIWRESLSIHVFICPYFIPDIGMMVRSIANVLGDLGSILDASLLKTQHYKV